MQRKFLSIKFVLTGVMLAILTVAIGCKQEATTGSANSGELAARVGNSDIPLTKVDRLIEQGLQGSNKKISDLSPVEQGGLVYVGSRDFSLYALEAASGKLAWRFATGGPIDDSSPVVAGGMVYVGSLDGRVYALPLT